MADAESNIRIDIDATAALDTLKNLQRQISVFHQNLAATGNAANRQVSENLQRNLVNNINATGKFSASLESVKSTADNFTTSLEKNKLSLGEYFKYGVASTQNFGKIFRSEFATIEKTARERVKTLQTQYIKMGRDANGAIQTIQVRPLTLDMENLATKTAMAAQKQQILNQLLKQGSTNLLNFGKNTQWAGRQLMVGFTIPLSIFGTTAVKSFQEMEEAVIKFQRVYGDFGTSAAETEKMVTQVKALANEFTKYGVAVADTMSLAADVAAMGKAGAELTAQVAEATRLAVLGGVEQSQALETTISMTNAFGTATEDLASKIDFLNSVENQTVTSIEDLTIAIPKAGPVIQQLGGNVEDLAFFLTAMKEGGINASEGANALKSGLASLINPTAKASEFMQGFGININGIVEANKGNVKGIVVDFAQALDQLDPLNRARAIEQLFGKFQFARLSTLFKNVIDEGSQASRVLDLTRASAAELAVLSERELKRVQDSPLYKFQKAIEDIQASLIPLGAEFLKLITPVIEFGTSLLKQFNSLDEGAKKFVTGLVAVIGLIAPAAIMTFGLVANGVANLIKGFNSYRTLLQKLSGATAMAGGSTEYLTQEQLQAMAAASSLNQVHSTLVQTFSAEKTAVQQLATAYRQAVAAQSAFGGSQVINRPPKKFAAGGIVRGPGTGTSDSIPAMLSNGESVIPAKQTQKYGALIEGIISDNIPGYARGTVGGYQETHVARPLLQTDAVLAEVDKFAAGFSKLPGIIREATIVLSDLTATKSVTLNQKAKNEGMTSEEFSAEWNKNSGEGFKNVAGRAQAAGQMGAGAEIDQAISELDIEIGQRVAASIDNGNIDTSIKGWLDNLMADVTSTVIEEFSVSGNAARQEVATGLKARAATPVTFRQVGVQDVINPQTGQPFGSADAYYKESGAFEARATAGRDVYYPKDVPEFPVPMGRTTSRGTARTNSARIGLSGKNVPGGTYETGARSLDKLSGEEVSPVFDAVDDGKTYGTELNKEVEAIAQDPYVSARDRNSPHRFAEEDGRDDADAYYRGANSSPQKLPWQKDTPTSSSGFPISEDGKYVTVNKQAWEAAGQSEPPKRKGIGGLANDILGSVKGKAKEKLTDIKDNIQEQAEKKIFDILNVTGDANRLSDGRVYDPATKKTFADDAEYNQYIADQKEAARLQLEAAREMNGASDTQTQAANMQMQDAGDGTQTRRGLRAAQKAQEAENKKVARQAAAQKRQRRAGAVAGALGTATMGLGVMSMVGGPMAEFAQSIMPVVTGLSILGPLLLAMPLALAGPVAAIGLVVAGLVMYNQELNKIKKEARDFGQSLSSGKDSMQRFAEAAGTATPDEIMDVKRSSLSEQVTRVVGKTSFGVSFFEGESGKKTLEDFERISAKLGKSKGIEVLKNQLATAIASGILTTQQAGSIALELGNKINDFGVSVAISAELQELFGPNGEKLLEGDVLDISLGISERSAESFTANIEDAARALSSNDTYLTDFFGFNEEEIASYTAGAFKGFLEEQQSAIDTFEVGYDEKINKLKEEAKDLESAGKDASLVYEEIAMEEANYLENKQKIIDKYVSNFNAAIAKIKEPVAATPEELAKLKKDAEEIVDLALQDPLSTQSKSDKTRGELVQEEFDRQLANRQGKSMSGMVYNSFEEGLLESIKDLPQEVKAKLEGSIKKIGDLSIPVEAKLLLNSAIVGGDLDPETVGRLYSIFDTELGEGSTEFYFSMIGDITLRGGSSAAKQLNSIFTAIASTEGWEDSDIAAVTAETVEFLTELEGVDLTQTLEQLQFFATFADLLGGANVIQNFMALTPEERKSMKERTALMDELIAKTDKPVTVEQVLEQKIITDPAMVQAFKNDAEYFEKLDPIQQFLYISRFIAISSTVTDDEAIGRLTTQGVEGALSQIQDNGSVVKAFSDAQIESAKLDITKETIETEEFMSQLDEIGSNNGGGGGGAEPTDPFAGILDALKRVRDAAINAKGGLDELLRIAGKGKDLTIFNGMDQQLLSRGWNEEFRSFISGLELGSEEAKKFYKINSDGVLTLTAVGKALKNAYDQKILGDFQLTQVKTVSDINNQRVALEKLTDAGVDLADAYKIVGDAALAAAIANGKISADEWKLLVEAINDATDALADFNAEQDIATQINKLGIDAAITDFAKKTFPDLTSEMLSALLGVDEYYRQIMANLASGVAVTQEEWNNFSNWWSNVFIPGLQTEVDVKPARSPEQIFQEGFGNAMRQFSAMEAEIQLKFAIDTKADQELIKAAENRIAEIQYQIDDYEAGLKEIEDKENDINDKYDDRFKALDKIEQANAAIAKQQKSQLTIADALSQGDIAAAAKAIQDSRDEAAQTSITNQKQFLEQQKENELANVRNNLGLTREEIEKRIKELQDEIFKIEEEQLEPAQERIRLAQLIIDAQIESLTVLGKTKSEWEGIQNEIDLAITKGNDFKSAMQDALDIIEKIRSGGLIGDDLTEVPNAGGSFPTDPGELFDPVIDPPAAEAPTITKLSDGRAIFTYANGDRYVKASKNGETAAQIAALVSKTFDKTVSASQLRLGGTNKDPNYLNSNQWVWLPQGFAKGGMVMPNYFNIGGFAKGTDTVPAMLTPGEFVVRKYAVDKFGVDNLKAINSGTYTGSSVYNSYDINVNVRTDANPDQIANAVMSRIRQIDSQRIRGSRI